MKYTDLIAGRWYYIPSSDLEDFFIFQFRDIVNNTDVRVYQYFYSEDETWGKNPTQVFCHVNDDDFELTRLATLTELKNIGILIDSEINNYYEIY